MADLECLGPSAGVCRPRASESTDASADRVLSVGVLLVGAVLDLLPHAEPAAVRQKGRVLRHHIRVVAVARDPITDLHEDGGAERRALAFARDDLVELAVAADVGEGARRHIRDPVVVEGACDGPAIRPGKNLTVGEGRLRARLRRLALEFLRRRSQCTVEEHHVAVVGHDGQERRRELTRDQHGLERELPGTRGAGVAILLTLGHLPEIVQKPD